MKKSLIDTVYENKYANLLNTGLIGKVFSLKHMTMERGLANAIFPKVLEVGAGQGQHLNHVKHQWDTYVETDIRLDTLVSTTLTRPPLFSNKTIVQQFADAENLEAFANESFDRVIVTCVLAHLKNPETALEEWRRVLVPGGVITIEIPSEPGMLLRLSRMIFTVPKAKRLGHDHLAFHYREHVNHFPSMKMLLNHVFRGDEIKIYTYPIAGLSWNFSLWKIFQIKKCPQANLKR
jgi:phosphatidylethanolamine/phosphatidyl-N-methylethanolamine N-methyltransferase